MLEKFNGTDAFILMESLLALSIVSFAILIILPFSVSMMNSRENRRIEIEGYRLLYDYSSDWQHSQSLTVKRSDLNYTIHQSNKKIAVTMPNHSTVEVKVESY